MITTRNHNAKKEATQGIIFRLVMSKTSYILLFAGEWSTEWSDEPTSIILRTSYVILFADCPVIWCSKIQTKIVLSTK